MTREERFMDAAARLALEIGFSQCGPVCPDALIVRDEIRAMCSADRCRRFGASWSCPPACGSPEFWREKLSKIACGILVQTTGALEDTFDIDGIAESERRHKEKTDTLIRQLKQLYPDCIPLASGSCTRCRSCTYPDRPCRFPGKVFPSMEAAGLWVSDVCEKSGMKYNYGENTMTYTACVLLAREAEV